MFERTLFLGKIIPLLSLALSGRPAGAVLAAQTPDSALQMALSLPVQARFATTDNLGNIYVVTAQNVLEKYASDGLLLSRYSNSRLGAASWIDPSNPLKILVWYGDFRTAVFLDRNLAALGELNLIAAGFPEVRTLTSAADGNLWVYDEAQFQLLKITPAGERLLESQHLNQLLPGRLRVGSVRDNGNEVLASDPETGMLWFDAYGQFLKILPWKQILSFTLGPESLEYLLGGFRYREQIRNFGSERLALPSRFLGAPVWLTPQGGLLLQNGESLEWWRER